MFNYCNSLLRLTLLEPLVLSVTYEENEDGRNAEDEMNIPGANKEVTRAIRQTLPPTCFRNDLG